MFVEMCELKMQTASLPAAGAVRAVELAVSAVMLYLSSSAHECYFIRSNENVIETFLKTVCFLQRYIHIKHPRRLLVSKRAVLMFIQRSQTPQKKSMNGKHW